MRLSQIGWCLKLEHPLKNRCWKGGVGYHFIFLVSLRAYLAAMWEPERLEGNQQAAWLRFSYFVGKRIYSIQSCRKIVNTSAGLKWFECLRYICIWNFLQSENLQNGEGELCLPSIGMYLDRLTNLQPSPNILNTSFIALTPPSVWLRSNAEDPVVFLSTLFVVIVKLIN